MPATKPLDEKTVRGIVKEEIKSELQNYPTKQDLKKELKNEIEKLEFRIAKSFEDNQQQMNGMKGDISSLKKDVSEIKHNMLTMEDNIVGAIHSLQIENSVTATYRPKIENHEQRITKLEKLRFAN